MSKHRYAAKRDVNEREIIDALEDVGAFVMQSSDIDLFVLYQWKWYPMEVKTAKGRLTQFQKSLHTYLHWYHQFDVPIVQTVDDALKVIGAIE